MKLVLDVLEGGDVGTIDTAHTFGLNEELLGKVDAGT